MSEKTIVSTKGEKELLDLINKKTEEHAFIVLDEATRCPRKTIFDKWLEKK